MKKYLLVLFSALILLSASVMLSAYYYSPYGLGSGYNYAEHSYSYSNYAVPFEHSYYYAPFQNSYYTSPGYNYYPNYNTLTYEASRTNSFYRNYYGNYVLAIEKAERNDYETLLLEWSYDCCS